MKVRTLQYGVEKTLQYGNHYIRVILNKIATSPILYRMNPLKDLQRSFYLEGVIHGNVEGATEKVGDPSLA